MENFEISGGYTHAGNSGRVKGTLRIYDDNKVVGTMNDDEDMSFRARKIVLGVINKDQFNFWKFPSSPLLMPLVYAMEGSTLNGYRGKWTGIEIQVQSLIEGVEGKKGLTELSDAFKSNNLEGTLDILGRIEKSRIESYLDPNLIKDIKTFSEETGYLALNRVKAFSA